MPRRRCRPWRPPRWRWRSARRSRPTPTSPTLTWYGLGGQRVGGIHTAMLTAPGSYATTVYHAGRAGGRGLYRALPRRERLHRVCHPRQPEPRAVAPLQRVAGHRLRRLRCVPVATQHLGRWRWLTGARPLDHRGAVRLASAAGAAGLCLFASAGAVHPRQPQPAADAAVRPGGGAVLADPPVASYVPGHDVARQGTTAHAAHECITRSPRRQCTRCIRWSSPTS